MTDHDVARINRARRAAERQGMKVVKSRRRDPRAADYDRFWLTRVSTGATVYGGKKGVTLDDIENYLDRPLREG